MKEEKVKKREEEVKIKMVRENGGEDMEEK